MKKKIVVLLCGCMMAATLAACGNSGTDVEVAVSSETEVKQESTSQEESTASTEEAEQAVLSDDLYSYQVSVDGTVYQIPMWYEEFAALGWEDREDNTVTLESNRESQYSNIWKKGDTTVHTTFCNMAANTAPYSECEIIGITFNRVNMKDDMEVILPKGIQMGVSTREDIIAAYGEPDSESETQGSWSMTYDEGILHSIYLQVDSETGTLYYVNIYNREALEGGDNSVASDVPESVKNYVAPTELGDDLYKMNVELDGHLYALPCPVAEFAKNGFELDLNDERTDKEIASGSFGNAFFTYNGNTVGLSISNYSPNATTPDNCFVTHIRSLKDSNDYEMVLPCGIKKGMTEAELLEILADYTYETESVGDSYRAYYIENPTADAKEIWYVNVDNGVVASMEANTFVRPEY